MATFLAVEVTGGAGPVADLSRELPAVALDFFLQVPLPGDPPVALGIVEATGGSAADRARFAELFGRLDPGMRQAALPGGGSGFVARFPLEHSPHETRALARFAARHRLPLLWGRLEQGIAYYRFLVEDEVDAGAMRDRLEGFLEATGVDAEAAVEAEASAALVGRMREVAQVIARLQPGPQAGAAAQQP